MPERIRSGRQTRGLSVYRDRRVARRDRRAQLGGHRRRAQHSAEIMKLLEIQSNQWIVGNHLNVVQGTPPRRGRPKAVHPPPPPRPPDPPPPITLLRPP